MVTSTGVWESAIRGVERLVEGRVPSLD